MEAGDDPDRHPLIEEPDSPCREGVSGPSPAPSRPSRTLHNTRRPPRDAPPKTPNPTPRGMRIGTVKEKSGRVAWKSRAFRPILGKKSARLGRKRQCGSLTED
ncbi:hypothetical protein UO65_2213 [Actinokineospora spheciospongiae]|uniref:Uncharacterized protein n=1 Tax=Actinokineospora spheciospongiae TaxID=909613 RepID=W7J0K6_9PSEU|nr:hypothetical protein UO65_2213 [Actinokineospora spheciospongiae]